MFKCIDYLLLHFSTSRNTNKFSISPQRLFFRIPRQRLFFISLPITTFIISAQAIAILVFSHTSAVFYFSSKVIFHPPTDNSFPVFPQTMTIFFPDNRFLYFIPEISSFLHSLCNFFFFLTSQITVVFYFNADNDCLLFFYIEVLFYFSPNEQIVAADYCQLLVSNDSQRKFRVLHDRAFSKLESITAVSQGSILGPIIYLVSSLIFQHQVPSTKHHYY